MTNTDSKDAPTDTELDRLEEQWLPVVGYEGLYEVSNTGKVRSLHVGRRQGRELKQCTYIQRGRESYKRITLCKNGRSVSINAHRVVAKAFLPNPDNKPTVNHKDGDKHNNNIANLEWATYSENNYHSSHVLGNEVWNKGRFWKVYCKRGHKFTPENTGLKKSDNSRLCRDCVNFRQRNRRRALSLQAQADKEQG